MHNRVGFPFFLWYDGCMHEFVTSIIPLDIAAILASPMMFGLSIFLLSQKYHPKTKLAAFFVPAFLLSALATFAGYSIGHTVPGTKETNPTESLINLIIGLLFLFLAFRAWSAKEQKTRVDHNPKGKKILKWFVIGLILNAGNLDALLLIAAAGREVGNIETISKLFQWLLLLFNVFCYTFPITFPVILETFFPSIAKHVLSAIGLFLKRYSRYIITGMFLLLGLVFLLRGL